MNDRVRAFVVDDSSFFRKLVRETIADLATAEVVDTASDGRIAIAKIAAARPDLVTLDVNMPGLNGEETLLQLLRSEMPPNVLLLSGEEPPASLLDVVAAYPDRVAFARKPAGADALANRHALRRILHEHVERLRDRSPSARCADRLVSSPRAADAPARATPSTGIERLPVPDAICIGASTGGPQALRTVLPSLPADFPIPVLVVQHMPASFTKSLAEDLDRRCRVEVREASDGDAVRRGCVLLAPGGRHLKVVREAESVRVRITDDPPEQNCRPAADYLFRSMIDAYANVAALVMTGMGADGAEGCAAIKLRGGSVICESAETCVVYGMPRAVAERGLADAVLPLNEIGRALCRLVEGGRSV